VVEPIVVATRQPSPGGGSTPGERAEAERTEIDESTSARIPDRFGAARGETPSPLEASPAWPPVGGWLSTADAAAGWPLSEDDEEDESDFSFSRVADDHVGAPPARLVAERPPDFDPSVATAGGDSAAHTGGFASRLGCSESPVVAAGTVGVGADVPVCISASAAGGPCCSGAARFALWCSKRGGFGLADATDVTPVTSHPASATTQSARA
jgi:hypothetical protein